MRQGLARWRAGVRDRLWATYAQHLLKLMPGRERGPSRWSVPIEPTPRAPGVANLVRVALGSRSPARATHHDLRPPHPDGSRRLSRPPARAMPRSAVRHEHGTDRLAGRRHAFCPPSGAVLASSATAGGAFGLA